MVKFVVTRGPANLRNFYGGRYRLARMQVVDGYLICKQGLSALSGRYSVLNAAGTVDTVNVTAPNITWDQYLQWLEECTFDEVDDEQQEDTPDYIPDSLGHIDRMLMDGDGMPEMEPLGDILS